MSTMREDLPATNWMAGEAYRSGRWQDYLEGDFKDDAPTGFVRYKAANGSSLYR